MNSAAEWKEEEEQEEEEQEEEEQEEEEQEEEELLTVNVQERNTVGELVSKVFDIQRWKKLKKNTQNFESEKLVHEICAKNAQNPAKLAKILKIA